MASRAARVVQSGCVLAFLAAEAAGATKLVILTHDEVRDPSKPPGSEVVSTQGNDTDLTLIPGFLSGPVLGMSESSDGAAETASRARADLGTLDVSARHAVASTGELREATSRAMASFTDTITFSDPGMTGLGSVIVAYEITGSTSATAAGTTGAMLEITDAAGTETLAADPGSASFVLDFEYGVPVALTVKLSVETEGLALGDAGELDRQFVWGGIPGLPATTTLESDSGTHWAAVIPEPGTALLLGSGLLGLAWRRRV